MAVAEYANALLVIPKTLAANAAKDATQLVAKLRAFHSRSQHDPSLQHLKWYSLAIFLINQRSIEDTMGTYSLLIFLKRSEI